MKLVLSRKGFDSAAGGVPSPIMPDGTMLSLPIPGGEHARNRFADIRLSGHNLGQLVEELSGGKVRGKEGTHHDPDLVESARQRQPGWRPLFGQADAEQTVLERAGVGAGAVFLFFGWFRRVEQRDGRWKYVRNADDIHVLWGWMQVAESWNLSAGIAVPRWAADHPHLDATPRRKNALYVGADELVVNGRRTGLPGAGVFSKYRDALRLTAPGESRSRWILPGWFYPDGRVPLGYHGSPSRWTRVGGRARLQTVGRGQELVLDSEEYPEAAGWILDLVKNAGSAREEQRSRACSR